MCEKIRNTKNSFWQIIQDNTIVIPQIQRDYAQGRNDSHVIEIRTRIIDRLFKAITELEVLDLDFVYGYNSDSNFIPLDGQQRLTTLFLIHWYIATRADVDYERLKYFRYETRQSSTDFVQALLKSKIPFADIEDNLETWIPDQRWFYHSWKKDPTIKAMLTMIQKIHAVFGKSDFDQLWKNITEINPITFNFLSIDNSGLTDELYIKMNSRGKPLTRFENFKVWFEKKIPTNKEWQNKIDNEWTNLFWNYRKTYKSSNSNDNTMDDEFMQFINGMLLFGLAKKDLKDDVQFFASTNDMPFSKYEEEDKCFFNDNDVDKIMKTLNWICNEKILREVKFWDNESLLEKFISIKPTYPDRIRFYCLVHYITQSTCSGLDDRSFKQWMRIMRNLIENTTIDSPDTFIRAIKAIDTIGDGCLDMDVFLRKSASNIPFFLVSQVEEEKIKTKLIEVDKNWLNELIIVENHELFRGCIGFILPKENESIEDFIKNREIASQFFQKDGSVPELKVNHLLIRAMLATNTIIEAPILLLDNGENWRKLLKNVNVKTAISKIIMLCKNDQSYKDTLNNVILHYNDTSILWRYNIVKYKELFGYSDSKLIRYYGNELYLCKRERWNEYYNNNVLISNYRNSVISKVLESNLEIKLISDKLTIKEKETGESFFKGLNVFLEKKLTNYNLHIRFFPNELFVGFLIENKEQIEVKIDDQDSYITNADGWLLAKKIGAYPTSQSDIEKYTKTLLEEITQIETMISSKEKV